MRNKTDVKKILEGIDVMLARLDEIVAKTKALEGGLQLYTVPLYLGQRLRLLRVQFHGDL